MRKHHVEDIYQILFGVWIGAPPWPYPPPWRPRGPHDARMPPRSSPLSPPRTPIDTPRHGRAWTRCCIAPDSVLDRRRLDQVRPRPDLCPISPQYDDIDDFVTI